MPASALPRSSPPAEEADAPAHGAGGTPPRAVTAPRAAEGTPFFETPASVPAPSRRLLLVSYHFPPDPEVGGLRWQKMSRFAVERGWGVDVVCADPSDLPLQDRERLRDLPPDVRVFTVPRPAESRLARWGAAVQRLVRRPVRDGAAAPAPGSVSREEPGPARVGLAMRARRAVLSYLDHSTTRAWAHAAARVGATVLSPAHRVVVSSAPPHMAHEAARLLARRAGVPFVMDMRDLWSQVPRVAEWLDSPVHHRLVARYERRCVEAAALVACNTEVARRAMVAAYPAQAARFVTVMNGSDPQELPSVPRDRCFIMAYAGSIYLDRDPRPLFRATARVVRDLGLTPDDLRIEFMGLVQQLDGVSLADLARESGVEAHVVLHPPATRGEALRFLAKASLLVSLPQDTHVALPSKVFEYSRFPAWVLALAEPHSATGLVLEGTRASVVRPDDVDGIEAVIRSAYTAFAAGERPTPVDAEGRFDRSRQAAILLDQLDQLTARR